MNVLHARALVLVLALLPAGCHRTRTAATGGEPTVAHCVFFTLEDSTPENCAMLVKDCQERLSNQPGTVYFAVGPRVADFNDPASDQGFDVSLVIVFKSKAALAAYLKSEPHRQFIRYHQETWARVRVFDWAAEPGKVGK